MHNKKLKLLLVISVLCLGFALRWKNYDTVPVAGDSLDEYSFTWVGLSLIKVGIPVGAIGVGGYSNNLYSYINVDRIFQTGNYASPIKINYPWFDHPPLLGLVTGGFAYMSGAKNFEDTSLHIIRRPMIVLGVIVIGLVIILGYEFYGFWPGILGGLIYAISPLIVVSSRMVQAENLLIVWFLLILIYIKKQKWLWVGIITSFAIWTKFSALAILPVIFWQIKKQNLRDFVLGLLPGLLLLVIYYGVYGLDTFWSVTKANGGREYALGINAFYDLITKTRITHLKLFPDGWTLIAWIVFFVNRKNNLLSIYILSCLAVFTLFGNYPHGWYTTPFWPVLFVMLGKYISEGEGWYLSFIPLGVGARNLVNIEWWRWSVFTILISSFLVKNKNFTKVLTIFLLVLAVAANIYWVYNLDVSKWYKI